MSKKTKIVYESEESLNDSTLNKKLKQIKQRLKDCQKEKEEYLTGWQRSQADLVNFRRRHEETLSKLKIASQAELIRIILPVLDSFDQVGTHKDITPINQQLVSALKSAGLKEIKAKGEIFDPQIHEAVQQIKSDKPADTVIEEVQKGYMLDDQLLRPSKVIIAK